MDTLSQPIFYRGYTIEPCEHLYKPAFMYYPTEQGIDAEYDDGWKSNVRIAGTLEEAKDAIHEKVMTSLPNHKVIVNGREYDFSWIEDAIKFAIRFNAEQLWVNGHNPATVTA